MIARITGTIVDQTEKTITIETAGIGYLVHTPAAFELGAVATVHTHMVVRDDCHELYGFATAPEKELFTTLIGVSGVGPKSALQMLCLYPSSELVRHIKHGDAKAISLVPGIGKKTAEKIVIDLKDKLDHIITTDRASESDIVEALLSLGYKDIQIRSVVMDVDTTLPIAKQITTALQLLQK